MLLIRFALIMLQESTEPSSTDKAFHSKTIDLLGWIRLLQRAVAESLVGAFFVEMDQVFLNQIAQMPLAKDEEMIQALPPELLHPRFCKRIHVRRARWGFAKIDLL